MRGQRGPLSHVFPVVAVVSDVVRSVSDLKGFDLVFPSCIRADSAPGSADTRGHKPRGRQQEGTPLLRSSLHPPATASICASAGNLSGRRHKLFTLVKGNDGDSRLGLLQSGGQG